MFLISKYNLGYSNHFIRSIWKGIFAKEEKKQNSMIASILQKCLFSLSYFSYFNQNECINLPNVTNLSKSNSFSFKLYYFECLLLLLLLILFYFTWKFSKRSILRAWRVVMVKLALIWKRCLMVWAISNPNRNNRKASRMVLIAYLQPS